LPAAEASGADGLEARFAELRELRDALDVAAALGAARATDGRATAELGRLYGELRAVLADELAPVVKVYAWQVILGRNGILNWLIPGPPVEWLLYSQFAVILTLSTTYITYTTIPIYAAMKAIEPATFEAATDLGAGWWQQARKILIPLAAPGIFVAMILVYIPMLTDFVTSDIVGGTGSYMMGQRVRDLILGQGDWGAGSALNFLLLAMSVLLAFVAYRLARLNRIES